MNGFLCSSRFHLLAMGVWALLLIPTLIWWRQSILWVAFMSIYACIATHHSAYRAARSEEAQREGDHGSDSDP